MGQASFDIGYVGPNQVGGSLSGPGVFSLSSRSNVPYVELIGRSGFRKVFSWGEIVEIPKQEQCSVKNASFHGGDIFINGGADYDTRPAAITIPVELGIRAISETNYLTSEWPVDTRMARRAYFTMNAYIDDPDNPGLQGNALIIGKRSDGSHKTENEITFEPGTGYQEVFELPILTEVGLIPLGMSSAMGDDTRPHALLTTARVYLSPPGAFIRSTSGDAFTAYYIVEY